LTLRKFILIGSLALFGTIALVALLKKPKNSSSALTKVKTAQEMVVQKEEKKAPPIAVNPSIEKNAPQLANPVKKTENSSPAPLSAKQETQKVEAIAEANRIEELFMLGSKNPVVETVTYTSRVPWIKGRPAWLADYASYYQTTRHFIARSLNHKADYFSQKISPGDRFNVFRKDRNIEFYLLIDLSRTKMWFYLLDKDKGERLLLKTYTVGVGRKEAQKVSGSLTPVGKYLLGSKVAIYKPEVMGYFQERKIEMIRVFGTRWIPFEKEVENCSEQAKGFGLHGAPWTEDEKSGVLVEDLGQVGKYNSDGCIRLAQDDIEEIFAIVISKPTTVEIVREFSEAKLPGNEVAQLTP
jgi:lipoprotein-anchoring transpeptidase ErfK/SrfK